MEIPANDVNLVRSVLAQDENAANAFRQANFPIVRRNLLSRCSDARSREIAEEIVADVFADCFGASGKRPLLELYSGKVSLSSWLTTVALNRLKNWWQSGRWRFERPESYAPLDDDRPGRDCPSGGLEKGALFEDREVATLLGEALLAAFHAVRPRDLVFLRLVHLYGVRRVSLADAWGVNPSTIGRAMTEAAGLVQRNTIAYLKELDPHLQISWDDCIAICARFPRVLLGEAGEPIEELVLGASDPSAEDPGSELSDGTR